MLPGSRTDLDPFHYKIKCESSNLLSVGKGIHYDKQSSQNDEVLERTERDSHYFLGILRIPDSHQTVTFLIAKTCVFLEPTK